MIMVDYKNVILRMTERFVKLQNGTMDGIDCKKWNSVIAGYCPILYWYRMI